MGSYPSADLLYGIDLGLYEESDWPWFTEELEAEHGDFAEALDHLLRGIEGVGHEMYGNLCSGYTGLALCTQAFYVSAYEAKEVSIETLTCTAGDDDKLRAAWAILYPDQVMPEPGWFIVVSYG